MVYIPEAIRNHFGIRFTSYQFGERKFRRLFPDAPIVEEDSRNPGQFRTDWSKYLSVFEAETLLYEFNRRTEKCRQVEPKSSTKTTVVQREFRHRSRMNRKERRWENILELPTPK